MLSYEVFDCNCTVGFPRNARPPQRCFRSAHDLLTEMDYFGISEALIADCRASLRMFYMEQINDQLLRWVDEGGGRLHACWTWSVTQRAASPDAKGAVERMLARDVKAVRLLPSRLNPDLVNAWICGGLLAALEERRIPVFLERTELESRLGFDVSVDVPLRGFSVDSVYRICQDYPSLPVIAMWMGGDPDIVVPLLESCPNLHLDFPSLPHHKHFEMYLRIGGAQRLLYGSGLPRSNPAKAMAVVNYSSASVEEKRLIFGGNLRRLLMEVS